MYNTHVLNDLEEALQKDSHGRFISNNARDDDSLLCRRLHESLRWRKRRDLQSDKNMRDPVMTCDGTVVDVLELSITLINRIGVIKGII